MCGITGIIKSGDQSPNRELLKAMTDRIQHRGPDDEGYFIHENVGFGHRRLSIIDLSKDGHQPMECNNLVITYNGELYNYIEIRNQLINKGYTFKTASDTEVVLIAYQHWGKGCLKHFNGMWAFAIYDKKKNEVFCARDRFGMKPFYYTQVGQDFFFASEIKAFFEIPNWQFKVNQSIAADFLFHNLSHHQRESIYDQVYQLMPGESLTYDVELHQIKREIYYKVDNKKQYAENKKAFSNISDTTSQLNKLLYDSINRHLRADVSTGAAVSGGIDSSAILSITSLIKTPEAARAIAYCPGVKGYDETKYLDDLEEKHKVDIHRIQPTGEYLLNLIDQVTKTQDHPLPAANMMAHYALYQKAKSLDIKVMLDGQGADELLAGYGTYYIPYLKYLGNKNVVRGVIEAFGMVKNMPGFFSTLFRKLGSQNDVTLRFLKQPISQSSHSTAERDYFTYSDHMITNRLLPALLHFEDRNSMANGVEARLPFLDTELANFCLSLPPSLKIRNGIRKWILRQSLQKELPSSILKRYDKMGFVSPQELWMESNQSYFIDGVNQSQVIFADWISDEVIQWSEQVLQKKERRYYPFIWRLVMLGRWVQLSQSTP